MASSNCPTPKKVKYETSKAANFFAKSDGMRAYKCPCGSFHLTSQPKRKAA